MKKVTKTQTTKAKTKAKKNLKATKILDLSPEDARKFLLKHESYCNLSLPTYFTFDKLLNNISKELKDKLLSNYYEREKKKRPNQCENVNYKLLNNKDGQFSWRLLQLINPALYVSLVHVITEAKNWKIICDRFNEFQKNTSIVCCSIPVQSNQLLNKNRNKDTAANISNWWDLIEQQSLELALEYEYILHLDISNCYGTIYTHSLEWAIHTKEESKKKKNKKTISKIIGKTIDEHLQGMSYGQTNGIPQGSVLMDFMAELVLGYADLKLSNELKELKKLKNKYKILRYRDDYRIFTHNSHDAKLITKHLNHILFKLGMSLNSLKTITSNAIIESSIKPDKLYLLKFYTDTLSLQKKMLFIYSVSRKFPNSGSITKMLNKIHCELDKQNKKERKKNIHVLISIIVAIGYKNPKTYPIVSAILSQLLDLYNQSERKKIIRKIKLKFKTIPNTEFADIWIQRIVIKYDENYESNNLLCKIVNRTLKNKHATNNKIKNINDGLWNIDWLDGNLKKIINTTQIVNSKKIDNLEDTIKPEEVQIFNIYNY